MSATRQKQQDIIKADLLAGTRVDSVTAFPKGITRLSSIIHRLKRQGLLIITERDKGNGIARYRLKDDRQGGDIEQSTFECCDKYPPELNALSGFDSKRLYPHDQTKKPQ